LKKRLYVICRTWRDKTRGGGGLGLEDLPEYGNEDADSGGSEVATGRLLHPCSVPLLRVLGKDFRHRETMLLPAAEARRVGLEELGADRTAI
jgi:hypothetical protein